MSKKKRNEPGRNRDGRRRNSKDDFTLFRHPLSNVEPAIIKAALLKVAERKTEAFPNLIRTILQILRQKYPPHIIGVMATYGLMAGVSNDGVAAKRLTPKLEQHHIELLQAFALSLPFADWGTQPATPQDIQKVIDTTVDLAEAFHHRRFKATEGEHDAQAHTVLALQERVRLHTQVVRNWGYFSEVVLISTELYKPFDESIHKAFGFGAIDLITTARNVILLLERRSNERFKWLKLVFRERTTARLVRAYYKHHPNIKGSADELLKEIPNGASREQVAQTLLSHADLSLVDVMTFTSAEITQQSGLPVDVTTGILNALSLTPGGLNEIDHEYFFMGNPVWGSPVIKVDEKYFCPIPQSVFSHIHQIMTALADKAGLKKALEKRRSDFLETKVNSLIALALPTAKLRSRVKWHIDAAKYETDHIAVIDRTVVIVEDKSAALTASGLRGAPDRVRRHVVDLIFAPSEQSARLEEMIWKCKAADAKATESVAPFGLSFADIERIVRISVTLDDFSVLASAEGDLKEAGWIPREAALATTLNVADFQIVIDILGGPALFLHYFAERERLQKALRIFADEIDFLGCYLETGFNFGNFEKEKPSLALTGMSAPIDRYYDSRDAGVMLAKPTPKLSTYFLALIRVIETRAFPRWSIVTTDLLRCANFEEQKRIERLLVKLKANVERNWRNPEHECSLVVTPPEIRDTAIVFFAYPPQLASRRKDIAETLAANALETSHRSRCVLVCRNTARWDEPYASILIVNKSGG